MKKSDGQKRSIYFQKEFLDEVCAHALRLERSFSWVIHYAWLHGRQAVERMRGPEEVARAKLDDGAA